MKNFVSDKVKERMVAVAVDSVVFAVVQNLTNRFVNRGLSFLDRGKTKDETTR